MENELDIIWGSRLFVNTQLVSRLVSLLVCFSHGKCALSNIFTFIHTIQKHQEISLYQELKGQLNDFIALEMLIQTRKIRLQDTDVINDTVNRVFYHFTKEELFFKDQE